MSWLSAAVGVVGTAVSAYSGYKQGQAQEKAYKASAERYELEAAEREENAKLIEEGTRQDVQARRRTVNEMLSANIAGAAAQGILVDVGYEDGDIEKWGIGRTSTLGAFQMETRRAGNEDIATIKRQGAIAARRERLGVQGALSAASASKDAADSARTSGFLSATATAADGIYKFLNAV